MLDFAVAIDGIFGQAVVQFIFISIILLGMIGAFFNIPSNVRNDKINFKKRSAYYRLSWLLVLISVALAFAIIGFLKFCANKDIDSKIASGVNAVVINGRAINAPGIFAKEISLRCDTGNTRSHPDVRNDVFIETRSGILHLQLGRDSVRPNSYWIFYPNFALTTTNEVRRACAVREVT